MYTIEECQVIKGENGKRLNATTVAQLHCNCTDNVEFYIGSKLSRDIPISNIDNIFDHYYRYREV